MAFYGFSDVQKILKTPVVTFWMLHKNIDRLTAEKDIRTANIAVLAQSEDGVRTLFSDLRKRMGTVVDFDKALVIKQEKLDRDGLHSLKDLGKANG